MVSPNRKLYKRQWAKGLPPDLLHAAEVGDYSEAIAALEEDIACVRQINNARQNAIQIAILNFHEDIAFLLLEKTNISVRNKDALGRDAFAMALFAGSEELREAISEKWFSERNQELSLPPPSPING